MGYVVRNRATAIAVLCLTIAAVEHASADDVDLAEARAQFVKSCGTCHVAEPDGGKRQGPNLYQIYGRKVGQLEGFQYSETLAKGDWVWTAEELDPWIENAQKTRPGTFMISRQRDPNKRALIIAYLRSLSSSN